VEGGVGVVQGDGVLDEKELLGFPGVEEGLEIGEVLRGAGGYRRMGKSVLFVGRMMGVVF